jgi:hypothetical protein
MGVETQNSVNGQAKNSPVQFKCSGQKPLSALAEWPLPNGPPSLSFGSGERRTRKKY